MEIFVYIVFLLFFFLIFCWVFFLVTNMYGCLFDNKIIIIIKAIKYTLSSIYPWRLFFSVKGDVVQLLKTPLRNSFAICSRFGYFYHRITGLFFYSAVISTAERIYPYSYNTMHFIYCVFVCL